MIFSRYITMYTQHQHDHTPRPMLTLGAMRVRTSLRQSTQVGCTKAWNRIADKRWSNDTRPIRISIMAVMENGACRKVHSAGLSLHSYVRQAVVKSYSGAQLYTLLLLLLWIILPPELRVTVGPGSRSKCCPNHGGVHIPHATG